MLEKQDLEAEAPSAISVNSLRHVSVTSWDPCPIHEEKRTQIIFRSFTEEKTVDISSKSETKSSENWVFLQCLRVQLLQPETYDIYIYQLERGTETLDSCKSQIYLKVYL